MTTPHQPEAAVSSLHIVVAEDEEQTAKVVCDYLRKLGHLVHHVRDGQELLDYCLDLAHPLDFVITDIVMPRLGGLEAMKQLSRRRRVPLIAISGNAYQDVVEEAVAAGCVSYLAKPISLPQLPLELVKASIFHRILQEYSEVNHVLATCFDRVEQATQLLMRERKVTRSKARAILDKMAHDQNCDVLTAANHVLHFHDLLQESAPA